MVDFSLDRGVKPGILSFAKTNSPRRLGMKASHWTYLRTAAVFAVALLLAPPTEAQIPTGTILGGVKDGSGGAVPGATVTATNTGTQYSRSTTTDAEGQYALRLLPVGNYQLTVTMS